VYLHVSATLPPDLADLRTYLDTRPDVVAALDAAARHREVALDDLVAYALVDLTAVGIDVPATAVDSSGPTPTLHPDNIFATDDLATATMLVTDPAALAAAIPLFSRRATADAFISVNTSGSSRCTHKPCGHGEAVRPWSWSLVAWFSRLARP
jgi:hypothetical protein